MRDWQVCDLGPLCCRSARRSARRHRSVRGRPPPAPSCRRRLGRIRLALSALYGRRLGRRRGGLQGRLRRRSRCVRGRLLRRRPARSRHGLRELGLASKRRRSDQPELRAGHPSYATLGAVDGGGGGGLTPETLARDTWLRDASVQLVDEANVLPLLD